MYIYLCSGKLSFIYTRVCIVPSGIFETSNNSMTLLGFQDDIKEAVALCFKILGRGLVSKLFFLGRGALKESKIMPFIWIVKQH